jgi:photosystem II stability/assembly factor-like uncharacterized protein
MNLLIRKYLPSKTNLIISLFILFSILKTADCYSQWIRQDLPPDFGAFDVRFINKYTGWLCGDSRIFKTTNSGLNWIQQSNPAQNILLQIHPVNENVIYACGYCTILKTTDGGENWIAIRSGTLPCEGRTYTGLWFTDENKGMFCVNNGYITRTTDGCQTLIDTRLRGSLWDVHFKNDTTGVMVGSTIQAFRTTNSGANWDSVFLPYSNIQTFVYAVSFVGDKGWLISNNNIIYSTSNYGISWDSLTTLQYNIGETSGSIEFPSLLTGYAGGNERRLFKTSDGGLNWRLELTSQFGPASYNGIYAYDDNIVWATGGYGFIIYTENGGLTESKSISNSIPEDYTLYQNYPNPFNPETKLRYDIRQSTSVKLSISDIEGKKLAILVDSYHSPGTYETKFNGTYFASGVYFCVLEADGEIVSTKKMMLLR